MLQTTWSLLGSGNNTSFTQTSTGSQSTFNNSIIISGTATAITVGSGSVVGLSDAHINSGNANIITGLGNVNLSSVSRSQAGGVISPSTTTSLRNHMGELLLNTPLAVAQGGSGRKTATTAYAVLCAGTTATAAHQSIASAGTSGQVLTSNGASALPTFQAAGGGGAWTLISTSTASTSATIDFTGLSSTYFQYMVVASNIQPVTDGVELFFRTSTDNGSSYDSGASDYKWVFNSYRLNNTPSNSNVGDTADSQIRINVTGLGNAANEQNNLVLYISNPSDTNYTNIHGTAMITQNDGDVYMNHFAGQRISGADVDAIRFLMSSGNISTGTFKLYGLTAS